MSVETVRGHRSRGVPYIGRIAICWECYSLDSANGERHQAVFDPRDVQSISVWNRSAATMVHGARFNVDPRPLVLEWFPGAPDPRQAETKYEFEGRMLTGKEIYEIYLQRMERLRDLFSGMLPQSLVKGNQPFWAVHYRDLRDSFLPGDVGVVTYGMASEVWITEKGKKR